MKRALWQLLLQPWRRSATMTAIATLLWLGAVTLALTGRDNDGPRVLAAMLFGFGCLLLHLGLGQTLRALCRPESWLLPRFRLALTLIAMLDLLPWVLAPALLACVAGAASHAVLVAALALLLATLGLAISCDPRLALLFWLPAVGAGWMPKLAARIAGEAAAHPLTPLLLVLVAAALVVLVVRPRLRIRDAEPDVSPLESLSMRGGSALGSTPRGAIGKRIAGWYERISQSGFDNAIRRYRQRPDGVRRLALIRALLLPHDHPRSVGLRLLLTAAVAMLYFRLVMQRPHFEPGLLGAYAMLMALSRFPQVGRGMLKMRPNLADLYLTLAPDSYAGYQRTIADALLWLVPVTVVSALAYTLLGIALAHVADPARLLLVTLPVATGASFAALALHLIGPENTAGRTLVNLVLMFGAMAVYWGGYWLIGVAGWALGGALVTTLSLGFGLGAWFGAQREYLRRLPSFEASPG